MDRKVVAIRSLILSPHPDDAVFSLGGAMLAGCLGRIAVATVFSRSRYCVYGDGEVEAVTEARCREDEAALAACGAAGLHLGLDDASLRPSYSDEAAYMDTSLDPRADPVWLDAVRRIGALIEGERFHRLVLPLAVGGMIDHVITRDAGLHFANHVHAIWFYKDATYLRPEDEIRALAQEHDARREITLGPIDPDAKRALVAHYPSQINHGISEALAADLAAYGGERVWIRKWQGGPKKITDTTVN